ncbi:uncharacterized protein PAC_13897 [Phialocephala subalpina]|uniref:Extracellular membrane protein CFEM domain-containing protein n=1 Tax=Phialocephala subalpina TaxID=576137 RepID=A0A1L7XG35_9HELO|nr:uncharacterized protein PAC_13897 [Phialocephala subalpina]
MQFTTAVFVTLSSVSSAQNWGNFDWGAANPCAQSCFASAYPGTSSSWSSHCATQTLLNNCINSACPTMTAVQSSASAAQSAQCSAYSSCSTVQDVCTNAYPWWGGWSAWGWDGPHHDGMYTVTASDSRTTGLTTRTVTSTFSGVVSTATQTATLVAAQAAAGSATASAAATATSTSNAAGSLGINAVGALLGAAVIAMVAM